MIYKQDDYVCWIEQESEISDEPITRKISVSEALARMSRIAWGKNKYYKNEDDALLDFMVIHWAWLEDKDGNKFI